MHVEPSTEPPDSPTVKPPPSGPLFGHTDMGIVTEVGLALKKNPNPETLSVRTLRAIIPKLQMICYEEGSQEKGKGRLICIVFKI